MLQAFLSLNPAFEVLGAGKRGADSLSVGARGMFPKVAAQLSRHAQGQAALRPDETWRSRMAVELLDAANLKPKRPLTGGVGRLAGIFNTPVHNAVENLESRRLSSSLL